MIEHKHTRLGVNVDHVATLRQQRDERYPDPVLAASLAEMAGADQITIHLREDRRHIVDRDLRMLRETLQVRMNLEMANTSEMIGIASDLRPGTVTLVPERREERTTEGGLDVIGNADALRPSIAALQAAGIEVSLFIDPDPAQIRTSREVGATVIELHTGDYAESSGEVQAKELERLKVGARLGAEVGLIVAAGHGLHYHNTHAIAAIPEIEELNIGHSIIARAVFVGLETAIREMVAIMRESEN
jgi:pyridoxine 5-phosphate synthase